MSVRRPLLQIRGIHVWNTGGAYLFELEVELEDALLATNMLVCERITSDKSGRGFVSATSASGSDRDAVGGGA